MLQKIGILLVLVVGLTSCSKNVTGNNDITTTQHDLDSFTAVHVDGNFRVTLTPDKSTSAEVTIDSNLQPYITTKIDDKVLTIKIQHNVKIHSKQVPELRVSYSELTKLATSGDGDLTLNNFSGKALEVLSNGNSQMTLTGRAADFTLTSNGSSQVDAQQLSAQNAEVKTTGGSQVKVRASKQLQLNLSGSSQVDYYGFPEKIEQSVGNSAMVNARR